MLEQKGESFRTFKHHVAHLMGIPISRMFAASMARRSLDFERVCCGGWVAYSNLVCLDAELMALDKFIERNRGACGDFKAGNKTQLRNEPLLSTSSVGVTFCPCLPRRIRSGGHGASRWSGSS